MLSLKKNTFHCFAICICLFALTFNTNQALAQKKPILTEEEQVQDAVTTEVDALFKSPEFLKKKNKKFSAIKGYMVVDIAVVQNGKLSSFFKVDSDIKDIDFMEYLSDTVLNHKFAFKLPKQQRYKIRQTINIE
ncbi:hypothetical protein [Pedobacter paludis]|uniref:TonB C-terminal domain-containing protein n=1 Tax=Pedobacter paludis TaxID=2203212 RepID=A0A317F172_9SPHI|nr:hypothetical protein [Pedobacter paludis]PWS32505.1 hypothetical protein DF947_05330 [Pedobacter paludis]